MLTSGRIFPAALMDSGEVKEQEIPYASETNLPTNYLRRRAVG